MPSVSLVIINHNYAAYLECAIESALRQTAAAESIVIVADDSTDGAHAIIEKYAERAILVMKPQGGHVSAVKAGFERVT